MTKWFEEIDTPLIVFLACVITLVYLFLNETSKDESVPEFQSLWVADQRTNGAGIRLVPTLDEAEYYE